MNRLELRALANLLEQDWRQPHLTGMAGAGEIDVLVTADRIGHCLVVSEPVLFVRDSVLV